MKNETESSVWVLSDNGVDVWHLSHVMPGGDCTTGQPNQRAFDSKSEAIAEIPEEYKAQYANFN